MDLGVIIIIFIVGFVSSFIWNIAGAGGGVIWIPILIFLGLPPHLAIATRRFWSLGSNIITFFQFKNSKKIFWYHAIIISFFTIIATIIGANILLDINKELLTKILSFSILIAIPFTFIKKNYWLKRKIVPKKYNIFGYVLYFFVDIIDTLIGAAWGYFTSLILISLMGLTYIEANATKKVSALIMSIVGSIMFAYHGIINYSWGIALMLGMICGGYFGVKTALKNGNYLVKIIFSVIVIISAIKLLSIWSDSSKLIILNS